MSPDVAPSFSIAFPSIHSHHAARRKDSSNPSIAGDIAGAGMPEALIGALPGNDPTGMPGPPNPGPPPRDGSGNPGGAIMGGASMDGSPYPELPGYPDA